MALAKSLFFLFLYHFLLLKVDSKCPKSFYCGQLGSLEFPFSTDLECGFVVVSGCDSGDPTIHFEWFHLRLKTSKNQFLVSAPQLAKSLNEQSCFSFSRNLSLPQSPFVSFTLTSPNLTFFTCFNQTLNKNIQDYFQNYQRVVCYPLPRPEYSGPPPPTTVYRNATTDVPCENKSTIPRDCSVIQLPIKPDKSPGGLFDQLTADFFLEWNFTEDCYKCYHGGGQCLTDNMGNFQCRKEKSPLKLILTIAGGGLLLLLQCLSISYIVWLRKKKINGSYLLSRNMSSNPSKSDVECGSLYFGIPIFSYAELEEATNNFDASKELGDGGFGTVYYGKLRDGREVAIKRLYEHNYRRVEQFLNEIKILTGLRHPNLVSLYGCTSRRSRELLLVYEYISNGTVADHLHGERAKEALLTWPIRMKIAIETAAALAYLHKSDIIHRDVKTNNILLDNNFSVKVADFGLSKLFPNDVTHISTAPQGTPGYVDPDYFECYQLTDKSDVYSFGVVLIELISSMPAVDINRHEINLADLAVNRIQTRSFDELIDPSLGNDSDPEVTRMTNSVAELAFRCLQLEKDMRPCMEEALAFLKDIQGGEDCNSEQNFEFSPHPLL